MAARKFQAALREPMLQLQSVVIIDLHGEINSTVELPLNAAYDAAEQQNPGTVILNFGDVDYINSTGIALIVGLLARARKSHRIMAVFGLSEHYTEIFNITRLADFMQIYPNEQSVMSEVASATHQTVNK